MKVFISIVIFTVSGFKLFAQTDTITRRDDKYLTHSAIPELLKTYESYLNIIQDEQTEQIEIKELIDRMVGIQNNGRIFFNEKVNIESDITPGSDTMKTPEDKSAKNYLEDFGSLYAKSGENTVEIAVKQISNLKKASYFYYNVLFDCTFHGKNNSKQSYSTVKRVVEIRIYFDKTWFAYINGIRFAKNNFNIGDTLNVFTSFSPTIFDGLSDDEYYNKLVEDKKKLNSEEVPKILEFIAIGDSAFDKSDYETAKSMYSRAWRINPQYKLTLDAREKVKKAIDKRNLADNEAQDRLNKIADLKQKAADAYSAYDFALSKQNCDSLILNYNITNDTIQKLRTDIAFIISKSDAVNNDIDNKHYSNAIDRCKKELNEKKGIVKDIKNQYLEIEYYYLRALAFFKLDSSSNRSKIYDDLNAAIENSKHKHNRAIVLRAIMYKNEHNFGDAITDASWLVNTHPTEPQYYQLLASIYEANNDKEKAIKNYAFAIQYKTPDTTLYITKARLECETGKYEDAVKTLATIVTKKVRYADAFYYSARGYEGMSDFRSAGKDYFTALKYGLDKEKIKEFQSISNGHFNSGIANFNNELFEPAVNDFTISILLDSNSNAFYSRAMAFRNLIKYDSAFDDVTTLINRDNNFPNAYYERGKINVLKKKNNLAIADFRNELSHYPNKKEVYFDLANAEISIEKYNDAGRDAEKAGRLFNDDNAFQLAASAYYQADSLSKTIAMANLAEQLKTKRSAIFYLRGRAYFDQKDFKKAKSDLDKSLSLNNNYTIAHYWCGRIYMEWKKYQDAFNSFSLAINTVEYEADANFYLGMCKISMKAPEYLKTASGNFNKAMEVNSKKYKNATTYSWMAYASIPSNIHASEDCLEKAKQNDSTNVVYYYVMACYKIEKSDYNAAIQYFEKMLSLVDFKKSEIEDESFFKMFRKNKGTKEKYNDLMDKYFK